MSEHEAANTLSDECLVCGGSYTQWSAGLLVCKSCTFVTTDLRLSHDELERLYSAHYFAGQEYKDYLAERELIEKQFRVRLSTLLRFVPHPESKRLLEIGSAYGFFLNVARKYFASVEGFDISREAVAYAVDALNLTVSAGDFLTHDLKGNVDVVCLWDTIEHLAKPHLYIEKAAAHMNRGGIVALTTGNIDSVVARWRGLRWRQIHPPTHLHYFSRATVKRLLAQHGFQIRHWGYEGMYRSIDTIAYIILNIRHRLPNLYAALKKTGVLNWSLYLNLYDIMFIVAEKNGR